MDAKGNMSLLTGREQGRDGQGRFVRGYSGNPRGRPLERNTRHLRHLVDEGLERVLEQRPELGPAIAEQLWDAALKAKPWAAVYIVDRLDGKPSVEREERWDDGHTVRRYVLTEDDSD
jgi:hypothetical protein